MVPSASLTDRLCEETGCRFQRCSCICGFVSITGHQSSAAAISKGHERPLAAAVRRGDGGPLLGWRVHAPDFSLVGQSALQPRLKHRHLSPSGKQAVLSSALGLVVDCVSVTVGRSPLPRPFEQLPKSPTVFSTGRATISLVTGVEKSAGRNFQPLIFVTLPRHLTWAV